MAENWKLSPSDLTFLWDECKRCFYLKVRHNFKRPAAPFPKVFSTIDLLMKDIYLEESTKKISAELPEGKSIMSGRWVTSQPSTFGDHANTAYLSGIFDTLVMFADGTYGIVDFKTTKPSPGQVAFYSRQLHAYAYALEHPAPGKLSYNPITRLGLLCFDPSKMDEAPAGKLSLSGPATWVECPLDAAGFECFMDEVLTLLEQPQIPEANADCAFCEYRDSARATDF
jgi:hypothetical protein